MKDNRIESNGPAIIVRQSNQNFQPPSADDTLDLQFDARDAMNRDNFDSNANMGGIGNLRGLKSS